MELEGLPLSVNNAYINITKGKGARRVTIRTLSKEGQKYKNETKTFLAQRYREGLAQFKNNEPYLVFFRFHMTVENATWGKEKGAESRYKKTDATNRIKLLEDVIKDITGIDDSCNLTVVVQKKASEKEKTEIFIWNTYREETPFDEALFGL